MDKYIANITLRYNKRKKDSRCIYSRNTLYIAPALVSVLLSVASLACYALLFLACYLIYKKRKKMSEEGQRNALEQDVKPDRKVEAALEKQNPEIQIKEKQEQVLTTPTKTDIPHKTPTLTQPTLSSQNRQLLSDKQSSKYIPSNRPLGFQGIEVKNPVVPSQQRAGNNKISNDIKQLNEQNIFNINSGHGATSNANNRASIMNNNNINNNIIPSQTSADNHLMGLNDVNSSNLLNNNFSSKHQNPQINNLSLMSPLGQTPSIAQHPMQESNVMSNEFKPLNTSQNNIKTPSFSSNQNLMPSQLTPNNVTVGANDRRNSNSVFIPNFNSEVPNPGMFLNKNSNKQSASMKGELIDLNINNDARKQLFGPGIN